MDIQIITKAQLQGLKDKEMLVGAVLMGKYTKKTTAQGKPYFDGYITSMGGKINFKVWDSSDAFGVLDGADLTSKVVYVRLKGNTYNGITSAILEALTTVDADVSLFLETRYDTEVYAKAFEDLVKGMISDKAKLILDTILFKNEVIMDRFKVEFAATSFHDNCKGGLLAHTYKVCNLAVWVLNTYPPFTARKDGNGTIVKEQDIVDLVMVSCALHDIGKIVEMNLGVYQPESVVTHNFLGTEFITPYKNAIIEQYSSDWYYNLIAVLQQHHGEFGERPKTVYAYLCHMVDLLESKMEFLSHNIMDMIEQGITDSTVKQDDYRLSFGIRK